MILRIRLPYLRVLGQYRILQVKLVGNLGHFVPTLLEAQLLIHQQALDLLPISVEIMIVVLIIH